MDDNPYASPASPGGFHEELDQAAVVKATLDERVLLRETRRIVELTGVGGYLGVSIFVGLLVVGLLRAEQPGRGPGEAFVVLGAVIGAVGTHIGTIRFLANRRLRKMRRLYDVHPGDTFEIEIRPGTLLFRSERTQYQWPMHDVAAIGGRNVLTFVALDVLTLPVTADAEFGELDLPAFAGLYKEQQRRYRETRSLLERLRYAFRGSGWA